jgi:hypothetical protein
VSLQRTDEARVLFVTHHLFKLYRTLFITLHASRYRAKATTQSGTAIAKNGIDHIAFLYPDKEDNIHFCRNRAFEPKSPVKVPSMKRRQRP